MYEISILPQAQRDLAHLDPPLRRRIGKRIDWLAEIHHIAHRREVYD